jgi:diguanylate cyclase (GGDEF)-like protein
VFWSRHTAALDLIVPVVFFLGACFVLLTGTLSLRTTIDVLRISVLERQASTDALTGVLNRRALDRRLSDEVARARRYSLPFSLLLFDVDHFKRINDNFGHPAGDRVLVGLAQIVTATLRETDIFARYGGEEFMIVAPHTTRSGVADLAERVRKRIESHDFGLRKEADASARVAVTASVGVATLGEQIDNVEKLVAVADKNLYRAKQEGRNRVVAEPLS